MTNTTKKLAKGIGLTSITVTDMKKAKHLFVDLLGMEVKDDQPDFFWMEVGTPDGKRIGIGAPPKENEWSGHRGTNGIISISVENIEEAIEALKSKGIEFCGDILEIPDQIKMILFQDADGNKFYLTEELN